MVSFAQLKDETKQALIGNRFMLFLAILVTSLITSFGSSFFGIGVLISPILSAGIFLIGRDLLEGKGFDFNRLFYFFKDLNQAIKLVGVHFLTMLIVFGGFLLFIIPGIIFSLQYSQALYIMADNPEMGVWDAMVESKRLMVGHKWEYFILGLSFIGHVILIVITFGIYGIYALPYIQGTMYNYYLHLSNQKQQYQTDQTDTVFEY